MRSFAPGERFTIPNGDTVFVAVHLVPLGVDAANESFYEVTPDGSIMMRELPVSPGEVLAKLQGTGMTVDDLTPGGDR